MELNQLHFFTAPIFHLFAPAKTCKICLLGAAPNPPVRFALLPYERSTGEAATHPYGRCIQAGPALSLGLFLLFFRLLRGSA